ncbi:MAG: hypothetical protein COZ56_19905 [Armatimonadetes bacterium CG_4_8_14_3_um_filter_58_9]|nr:MAG: hypothetical protein COZ56_19905 [Armatimonadetes bacterium CG_4_8_14_3_um_filter_58_9]
MKFLLDLGITPHALRPFRSAGHEAHRCTEFGLERASDEDIVEFAREGGFAIVTTDKRFGDIVMLSGCSAPTIVLLRLDNPTFRAMVQALDRVLRAFSADELTGAIVTVESNKLRRRSLG